MVARRRPLTWTREGECIRCTSHALNGRGYPTMRQNGKNVKIARMILIRRIGDIPPSVVSRHTCDNTWCIRPDHIISGTQAQNNTDRKERGRSRNLLGESSPRSKLTSLQVLQIREATGMIREIAKKFETSESNVQKIRYRKRWKHL